MPRTKVFLDASYAIALATPADSHHSQAAVLSDQLLREHTQLVTTRAVMIEIGNFLAKRKHRPAAIQLLAALERDPLVDIVPVAESLCQEAFGLYRQRPDKDWGMTDCISFVVMKSRTIHEALTTDEHFQQAGFRALLRE